MAEEHVFTGVWITDDAFAALSPLRVFHRENAPMLSAHDASKQNAHILFRDTFTVTDRSAVTVCISADDYFKLYINGKFVMQGAVLSLFISLQRGGHFGVRARRRQYVGGAHLLPRSCESRMGERRSPPRFAV